MSDSKRAKSSPEPRPDLEFRYRLAMRGIRASSDPVVTSRAIAELKRCAQGGHRDAQFELGALNKLGQGVGKNRVRALGWFLRATVQHDVDAAIQAGLLMDVLQPDQVWRAQRWAYNLREDERWATQHQR